MNISGLMKISNDTRLFYRFPKILFEDPELMKMSTDAKMLYTILLDRRSLSENNGSDWQDT